jgi:sortase (surface protein transpeptidase)
MPAVSFGEWVVVSTLVVLAGAVLGIRTLSGGATGPPERPTFHPSRDSIQLVSPPAKTTAAHLTKVQTRRHRPAQEPRPTHIEIPAIGVSARIVKLGLNPDKTMETPTNYATAGWYEPGPEPGERGAAVIAGHVDNTSGPAVFFKLGELRRGNVIRIKVADGRTIRFRVTGLERWPKSKFPTKRVFGRTRAATLRLITCGGAFDSATGHYIDNTVVYAVRRTAGRN